MDAKRIKYGTLISCCLSCFIAWLDFAIVNTALPDIEQELSTSLIQLQWVINAFVFSMCVLLVICGRISDHIGRRKMNMFGVALFGLSSLGAGIAPSAGWLIFARLLQGAASAAIVPSSLALISHAFPGDEKGRAIGIWAGATGLGMAIGPVIGGILVSAFSWRWIFYINVPMSILSLIICYYYTQESLAESNAMKPDIKGVCLLAIGLGSLIFGLMHGPDWGWTSLLTISIFIIAVAVLTLFYFAEKSSTSPTIPFSLFSNCTFFCATLTMFSLVFVFTANLFLVPLYLIQVRHQPAYVAGLCILPITAGIAILSPYVGHLMTKISAKKLIFVGLIIYCLSTVLQAFIQAESPLFFILPAFALLGIGWGIARTPATTSAIASVPHHFAGTATGVLWTVQNAGGALSVAITLTLFRKIFEANPSPEAFLTGYHTCAWLLSAVTFSALLIFYLKPQKNNEAV